MSEDVEVTEAGELKFIEMETDKFYSQSVYKPEERMGYLFTNSDGVIHIRALITSREELAVFLKGVEELSEKFPPRSRI